MDDQQISEKSSVPGPGPGIVSLPVCSIPIPGHLASEGNLSIEPAVPEVVVRPDDAPVTTSLRRRQRSTETDLHPRKIQVVTRDNPIHLKRIQSLVQQVEDLKHSSNMHKKERETLRCLRGRIESLEVVIQEKDCQIRSLQDLANDSEVSVQRLVADLEARERVPAQWLGELDNLKSTLSEKASRIELAKYHLSKALAAISETSEPRAGATSASDELMSISDEDYHHLPSKTSVYRAGTPYESSSLASPACGFYDDYKVTIQEEESESLSDDASSSQSSDGNTTNQLEGIAGLELRLAKLEKEMAIVCHQLRS